MNSIKVCGVAVLAAFITLAFVGAGSASATSLCKEKVEVCPKEKIYPMGSILRIALEKETKIKFGSVLPVECEASAIVDVLIEGTNPLIDEVSAWTYSKCKSGGTECTVTAYNVPLKSEIEYSALNPTLILAKLEKGEPKLEEKCGTTKCVYGTEKVALDFQGGEPAKLLAKEEAFQLKEGSEMLCGATGKLTGTYVINEVEISKVVFKSPPVFVTK